MIHYIMYSETEISDIPCDCVFQNFCLISYNGLNMLFRKRFAHMFVSIPGFHGLINFRKESYSRSHILIFFLCTWYLNNALAGENICDNISQHWLEATFKIPGTRNRVEFKQFISLYKRHRQNFQQVEWRKCEHTVSQEKWEKNWILA